MNVVSFRWADEDFPLIAVASRMVHVVQMVSRLLAAAIAMAAVAADEPGYVQPDEQFVEAIDDDSTNSYLVLITVTDLGSGKTKSGCVTANLLLGAIHREHGLDYDEASLARARELALASKNHHFAFREPAALENISFNSLDKRNEAACELVRAGYAPHRADVTGQIVAERP